MMIRHLKNRNVIFLLAIGLGLIVPQPAVWTKLLMLPALAMIMTLATMNVPNNYFRNPREILMPSLWGIVMTYVILGGVILIGAALIISNSNMWIGFVLIAAVPPAVAVIPFTGILDGNVSYTLSGTIAAYLGALIITPLMLALLLGSGLGDPYDLLKILVLLIMLPLILSRFILVFKLQVRIEPVRGLLTDWGFFIVVYTMIAVNSDLIFARPLLLVPVATVVFIATFVLGFVVGKMAALLGVARKNIVSLVLLGTLKNQGIAGGLAITLFTGETALPSAVYSVFMIVYIMWLDWRKKREL
jgi:BASS family bile acid:Na+ symporter